MGDTALRHLPTMSSRGGDFGATVFPLFNPLSVPPATRTRFTNDVIPASRMSAQSQNLLKLIPLPNIPAVLDQPNFASSGGVKFNDDAFNIRVDHFTTDKLHLFGRYSLHDFRMVTPGSFSLISVRPALAA